MKRSRAVAGTQAVVLGGLLLTFILSVFDMGGTGQAALLGFGVLAGAAVELFWPERPIRPSGWSAVAVVVRNGILGGLLAELVAVTLGFALRYLVHGSAALAGGESCESYWAEIPFWGLVLSPIAMVLGVVGSFAAHLGFHQASSAQPR